MLAGLAFVGLLLSGCGQIQISQDGSTPVAGTSATNSRRAHDLAVLGAEISPPLDGAISLTDGATSFELQVAIENKGSSPERDVIVEGWLQAPDANGASVLVSRRAIVPYIAPGEVKVAKLAASGVVPILSSYTLVVSVRPVLSETYIGNNTSEYQISVNLSGF
jgi:hypothetical protein